MSLNGAIVPPMPALIIKPDPKIILNTPRCVIDKMVCLKYIYDRIMTKHPIQCIVIPKNKEASIPKYLMLFPQIKQPTKNTTPHEPYSRPKENVLTPNSVWYRYGEIQ